MAERTEELNKIQTWRQGAFIDGPRYKHWTDDEKETARYQESWLVRPSAMGNAICVVRERPEDAAWIAERLNKCAELEADPLKPLKDLGYTPTPTGLVAPIGEIEKLVKENLEGNNNIAGGPTLERAWAFYADTQKWRIEKHVIARIPEYQVNRLGAEWLWIYKSKADAVRAIAEDFRQWLISAMGGEVEG